MTQGNESIIPPGTTPNAPQRIPIIPQSTSGVPSVAAVEEIEKRSWTRFAFSRFFPFLGWVFSGFGLIPLLFRQLSMKRGDKDKFEEIVVFSVHRSFFLWLLILVGFVTGPIVNRYPSTATFLGWVYVATVMYTLLTLLFDISTLKLLLWAGIFLLLWVSAKYIEALNHIPLVGGMILYMKGLNPVLSPGMAVVLSILLLPAWVGSLVNTFLNGRKRFTPNEIGEFHFGEGHELTDRTGLRFKARYRDVFESILGLGAGDLIAMDNHQREVKRYENILFLTFVWGRMDRILHQRSAIVDNASGDPMQVEAVGAGARAPRGE